MKTLRLLLLLTLLIEGIFSRCSNPEIKVSKLPPLPEPVSNNAVATYQDNNGWYLYSFGGIDSTLEFSGIHRRSYRFSSQKNSWERISDLPDTLGKIASSAVRVGKIIYITGGYYVFADGHEVSSSRVHRYHTVTNKFLEDAAPLPVPIDDHVQVSWRDSLIFVITGWSNNRNSPAVQIYDPGRDEWSLGTPLPADEEYMSFGASGAVIGDRIFFMGGARYAKFYPAQQSLRIGIIDPDTPGRIQWAMEPDAGRRAYRSSALALKEKIVWIGGSTITYNYNGIAYESKLPVQPSGLILEYSPGKETFHEISHPDIPMDLRNAAKLSDHEFVLVGGISHDRIVTPSVIKITMY